LPRRILIIQGHPDPDPARLCRALAEAYETGAWEGGHPTETVDLAALDVPPLRSRAAFEHEPVPESLAAAAQAIRTAEHIVLIFPLWLGTLPAAVKAFLEQAMRPGLAFDYDSRHRPRARLHGRTTRLVVTMGMPALAYRLWYGGHGLRALDRSILRFAGIRPVRWTLFGGVEAASAERRARWIERMRTLGRRGR